MTQNRLYFGYGSNLDWDDWVTFCRKHGANPNGLKEREPAWLVGHHLTFHYYSSGREGGAADVVPINDNHATPETSWELHEELLQNCVDLWDSLGLHYEVVNICTGDMGTVAARKYDLEAWLPGAKAFKEIVSCSNCTDYQANRLEIRYGTPGHPNQPMVHTLNSTAVATSRALVAIIEQNQLEDGRVRIPDVLQSYMQGQEILEPCTW